MDSEISTSDSTKKQTAQSHLKEDFRLISKLLPNYKLLKLVGQGTYGSVYKAQQASPGGEVVAIKHMKNILRSDLVARQVVREVQILRLLSAESKGKHICELKDLELAQVDGELHIFLIMTYVGTTLDRFMLSNRHNYREKHIIKLAYNILSAL